MTSPTGSSRETRFRYDVEGRLVEMVARNGETSDQVTRWEYGTTLLKSGVARNDLLRAKIYSDGEQAAAFGGSGDRVECGYNRQGELIRQSDQNATVREFGYDGLGRLKSDAVTTLGSGLDGTVRALGRSYDERGLLQKVTSYADAAMTTVVNEVAYSYNGAGQETSEAQAHGGATGAGTPQVTYEYASGADNTRRRTKVIYPNGRQLEYRYGTAGSIDDLANRVEKIVDVTGTAQELVQYTRRGVNSTVRIQYLEPGLEMTYLQQTGQPVGDGGDRYKGLDRFNRIEDILWLKTSSAQERDRTEYGFDRAGNRTWRRNRRAPEDAYDENYSYDGLYQLTALTRGNLNQNRTATSGVPSWAESFTYDPTGNWEDYQTRTTGGVVSLEQSRTHNRANEITFIDGANATIAHDGAGNTTRMPSVADWSVGQQLKWDAWNRLVEVSAGATVLGKYRYDGTTRRVWKQSSEGGTPVDRHYLLQRPVAGLGRAHRHGDHR